MANGSNSRAVDGVETKQGLWWTGWGVGVEEKWRKMRIVDYSVGRGRVRGGGSLIPRRHNKTELVHRNGEMSTKKGEFSTKLCHPDIMQGCRYRALA
jgi:hypothetical protein